MAFPFLLIIMMGSAAVIHAEQEVDEYKVKAVFLYNFAKFVDWPAEAVANGGSPLAICVLGSDPFGSKLDIIKDKTVKGRRIAIRHLESAGEIKGCRILFISGSEDKRLRKILGTLRDMSVLTVGDTEGFGESGIMINFYTSDNKIRLEVNLSAARRAGLKISSELLKIARII